MSLLTPIKVPVKVYKWDDVGAPALDKSVGCVSTIFKSCLVTGYGTKTGAGWTMPFGDTASGVKVLRPEVSSHTDFYLRLSGDTGTEVAAQVYLNMTDVSTGDLKLQCDTPFKYAKANSTGKWLLIASSRGVWFFCDQRFSDGNPTKTSAFFYVGDVYAASPISSAVMLNHSGGTANDGAYNNIFGLTLNAVVDKNAARFVPAKMLTNNTDVIVVQPFALTNGTDELTTDAHISPVCVIASKQLYFMPGAFVPTNGANKNNYDTVVVDTAQSAQAIVASTGGRVSSNLYISTDNWEA